MGNNTDGEMSLFKKLLTNCKKHLFNTFLTILTICSTVLCVSLSVGIFQHKEIIEQYKIQIEREISKVEDFKRKNINLNADIAKCNDKINELEESNLEFRKKNIYLEAEIQNIKDQIQRFSRIDHINGELKEIQKKIVEKQIELKKYKFLFAASQGSERKMKQLSARQAKNESESIEKEVETLRQRADDLTKEKLEIYKVFGN